jgi:8-oxo-dGTP diphosphatase
MIVVLPVLASSSHPDIKPMGWPTFNAFIQHSNIPVYAMGGMQKQHLNVALENSARGIAMQHAIWN